MGFMTPAVGSSSGLGWAGPILVTAPSAPPIIMAAPAANPASAIRFMGNPIRTRHENARVHLLFRFLMNYCPVLRASVPAPASVPQLHPDRPEPWQAWPKARQTFPD